MLTLITAVPGSGKSQYAIERFILGAIRENEADIADWNKRPERQALPPPMRRQVFTNIKGMLRPDRVAKIQELVGGLPLLQSPDDWRSCPDGSVVIYDEAQQKNLFRATGKPGIPTAADGGEDERITGLDQHRHRGFDIVLITQDAGLIHHWAKKFVGRHIHLERTSGAEMMTVHQWDSFQADVNDYHVRQGADTSVSMMHKATWELYDSATVHTHKFEMPKGARFTIRMFLLLALLLPAMFIGVRWWFLPDADASASEPPAVESRTSAALAGLPLSVEDLPASPFSALNGCASGRHCRCWDNAGQVMSMDDATCRNFAEGIVPMPIDLNRFARGSTAERREGGSGKEPEGPPAPRVAVGVAGSPSTVGSPSQGEVQGVAPETLRASGM